MKFNCGETWSQKADRKRQARNRALQEWHFCFVIKKRFGDVCYVMQKLYRKREYLGDGVVAWDWQDPQTGKHLGRELDYSGWGSYIY